ncbi:MAG: YIP1 family protein [Candidatus Aminicenantes bacterium]|nr:MAG: YIP1 family protein [Candidatus Aminicenantes bacterium]
MNQLSGFLNEVAGIIRTPGHTLGQLMEGKKWVPVFLLLAIAIGIFTYVSYPLQMARLSENSQLAGQLSDEELSYFIKHSTVTRLMASVLAIFGLVVTLIFDAFFVYLFFGIGGSKGEYGNYFALVVNASVIDTFLPSALRTGTLLFNIDLISFSKPALLFFPFDPGNLIYLILSRLDIFAVWYLVAIAAGIHVFSKMSFKKSIFISILYFLFKLVVGVAFSYLFFKIAYL